MALSLCRRYDAYYCYFAIRNKISQAKGKPQWRKKWKRVIQTSGTIAQRAKWPRDKTFVSETSITGRGVIVNNDGEPDNFGSWYNKDEKAVTGGRTDNFSNVFSYRYLFTVLNSGLPFCRRNIVIATNLGDGTTGISRRNLAQPTFILCTGIRQRTGGSQTDARVDTADDPSTSDKN